LDFEFNWVVGEMESRYTMLSKSGARNIQAYRDKGFEMPHIVIIIDEYGLETVSLNTLEASMEDAFLMLTGEKMQKEIIKKRRGNR